MNLRFVTLAQGILLLAGAMTAPVFAQTNYNFVPTGTADYNVDANWLDTNGTQSFVPEGQSNNEAAFVGGGGTAVVNNLNGAVPSPGALTIGAIATGTTTVTAGVGTIEVASGGTLSVIAGTATTGAIQVGTTGTGTVRIKVGGTLTSTSAFALGADAADTLIVGEAVGGGTATLQSASMSLNGSTQVFPNGSVTTSGNGILFFGSPSVFTSEINASGAGKVSPGGNAILNGRAHLNFTGVTPTVGTNYTIAEADSFEGTSFNQITTNASVAFNQVFVPKLFDVAGPRKQLRVGLEETIVVEVNRDSGLVTMTHPGSGAIAIDSYFIGSASNSLVPGSFSGVTDQGLLGGSWVETELRTNNIAELKSSGSGSFSPGTPIQLGNIFNPLTGAFGTNSEDLQFTFSRFSDGAQVPAVVQYSGTRVNNLLLQIDPTGAGDAYLRNTSLTTAVFDFYHVLSTSGRLSPAAWNSLDEQNIDGAGVWVEALNNDATRIAEFNSSFTTPYLTLDPGESYNLGKLFLGGTQDLMFQFQLQGNPNMSTGRVIYEAFVETDLTGDYNDDGTVDAADYTVWRNNLNGPGSALHNRHNSSGGNVSELDYTFWKQNYGASGSGGGGLASAASTPEPASIALLLLAAIVTACVRRGSRA